MNINKTLFAFIAVAVIAWTSSPAVAQFNYGVKVGYSNNHYSIGLLDVAGPSRQQHGLHIGGIISYTYHNAGWLETGLTLQQRGFTISPNYQFKEGQYLFLNAFDRIKTNGYSLDVPLWLGIKFHLPSQIKLIPKAGVFFSYGLSGSAYLNGKKKDGEPFSVKYKLFSNEALIHSGTNVPPSDLREDYQRVDAGLQVGLDIVWNQFALRSAYQFGVADHNFFRHSVQSRTFSISAAYYFMSH